MSKSWPCLPLRWMMVSAWMVAMGPCLPGLVSAQDLTLRAPPRCGTLAALQARVAQLAGADAASRARGSITIRGPARGTFQLEAKVGASTRRSQHADCRVLFDAAVLIVVFSVNPALSPDARAKVQQPAPEQPGPPVVSEAPEVRRGAPHGSMHAELALAHAVLPRLAVPVSLGFRVAVARTGATLALRYAPPVRSAAEPGVRVQLLGSTLVGHYAPWSFLQVGAGLEGDLLVGRGIAVVEARRDVTSRLAVRFELLLRRALRGRHQLALASALALAVHRPAFEVIDHGPVFRPGMLTFSAGLRWEVTIF